MLGDNRASSYDSEEWGPIKKSDILGSPSLRIIPFNLFGVNPAEYNFKK
jgi:type IV secretory pathway protease TraF